MAGITWSVSLTTDRLRGKSLPHSLGPTWAWLPLPFAGYTPKPGRSQERQGSIEVTISPSTFASTPWSTCAGLATLDRERQATCPTGRTRTAPSFFTP